MKSVAGAAKNRLLAAKNRLLFNQRTFEGVKMLKCGPKASVFLFCSSHRAAHLLQALFRKKKRKHEKKFKQVENELKIQ